MGYFSGEMDKVYKYLHINILCEVISRCAPFARCEPSAPIKLRLGKMEDRRRRRQLQQGTHLTINDETVLTAQPNKSAIGGEGDLSLLISLPIAHLITGHLAFPETV